MSPVTTRSERRKRSRKRPLNLVYVELPSGNGGMMRDLSEEGFAVRAMMPLHGVESTPFSFSLGDVRIEGQGHVQWLEESGHVVGVNFTEISPTARQHIRAWLLRPEEPPKRDKPAAQKEVSLDELREEMHSVPPRPEGKLPMHPAEAPSESSAPEMVASADAEQAGIAEAESEEMNTRDPEPVISERAYTAVPQPVSNPVADASSHATAGTNPFQVPDGPRLPRLTLTPKIAELDVPPAASASEASPSKERVPRQQHWKPNPPPSASENESHPPEALHPLPDISTILMQPPGKAPAQQPPPYFPPVETLHSWNPGAPSASWTDRISLSSAVGFMTVLALLAGLYVFHREVGQGLIFLGAQLSGAPQTAPAPIVSFGGNISNPNPSSQNSAAASPLSATQPGNSVQSPPPAISSPAANGGSSDKPVNHEEPTAPNSSSNDSGAANSAGTRPPIAATPLSNVNSDVGQAEFTQAVQILRRHDTQGAAPEALRLLWIAVEKGNPNAELELADMYWRGRGVIQNCDQARILLTAAARKGSTEAQHRLVEFQKAGCE